MNPMSRSLCYERMYDAYTTYELSTYKTTSVKFALTEEVYWKIYIIIVQVQADNIVQVDNIESISSPN